MNFRLFAPFFVLQLFLVAGTVAIAQPVQLPLYARWDNDSIPEAWTGAFSECGGYLGADGREYAFIGSTQGTYFFEITDPVNPRLVNYFPTKDTVTLVVNKDYAVYQNYVYAVSDQGDNAMQIFDMQYLPDSVVKVYDANTISRRCHTLFVENGRLYMCSNSHPDNSFSAMDIYDLSNPVSPQFIGKVTHPGFYTVHEVFVRNDTAWCSTGNTGLWIYDVSNAAAPHLISVIENYTEAGYNHSSWLTADSKILVFTDENHGSGVKVFDVADPASPEPVTIFRSNLLNVPDPYGQFGPVAHIPVIYKDKLVVSYYHDGVMVYDLSAAAEPQLIAYYDTYPENTDYASYKGCWGVDPFLPSHTIIASDIKNGLILLDGRAALGMQPVDPDDQGVQVLGNPVQETLYFQVSSTLGGTLDVTVYDVMGRLVKKASIKISSGTTVQQFELDGALTGTYILKVTAATWSANQKFLKARN